MKHILLVRRIGRANVTYSHRRHASNDLSRRRAGITVGGGAGAVGVLEKNTTHRCCCGAAQQLQGM
jgi:hypothetical protein